MKKNPTRRVMLASAVAGLFALAATPAVIEAAEDAKPERCYGINTCKGTGDCGGKGHSCAGENECKGKGYLNLPNGACEKIQGGRLTEEPAKS